MAQVEVTTYPHADSQKLTVAATFDTQSMLSSEFVAELIGVVADKIAERYVSEHYAELVAKLDQQAVANLAIADAGKKIAEEIRQKPTVLHDRETHTEVYQRGVFGGMRRVR